MTFGLGGRGATLFKRYHAAAGVQSSPLNDLFGLFVAGAGLAADAYPNRGVLSSPQAKMEVVLGMIAPGESGQMERLSAPAASAWIPLGETLAVRTSEGVRTLGPAQDGGDLRRTAEIPFAEELPCFRDFLKELRRLTGVDVDLHEDAPNGAYTFIRKKVTDEASSYLRTCARLRNTDVAPALEPPFIAALRALLDRIGRPLTERAAYLGLRDL